MSVAISSVWSAYGHAFITEDGFEVCLVCGAVYELVTPDVSEPSYGEYRAANGGEPRPCSRDTSMDHGEDASDPHCNCVRCTS